MASSCYRTGTARNLATACALGMLLTGCAVIGPNAIGNGRLTYSEAITQTNNEQMLMAVIHNRYQEHGSMLAVASITANVHVSTGAAVELGVGDSDNYAGNLVPFRANAVYEENPTISYAPVAGEKYLRQIMAPIPLALVAQLAGTMADPAPVYLAVVASMNGITNPDFLFTSSRPDPRFARLVEILTTLGREHRLHWVEDGQHANRLSIVIDHYAPAHADEVAELFHILKLPAPREGTSRLVVPVYLALDTHDTGGISVTTRSIFRLVEILSAAIELPAQERLGGAAAEYPPLGTVGTHLHIRVSDKKPDRAAVAVRHRDRWFYIDDGDLATKGFFRLLSGLWSVAVAETTAASSAPPVLTIPASR